jgi:hypothetical protein
MISVARLYRSRKIAASSFENVHVYELSCTMSLAIYFPAHPTSQVIQAYNGSI